MTLPLTGASLRAAQPPLYDFRATDGSTHRLRIAAKTYFSVLFARSERYVLTDIHRTASAARVARARRPIETIGPRNTKVLA